MNRAEHLAWAKQRALEYVDQGDIENAFASMASDLRKHPDLENHAGIQLNDADVWRIPQLSGPDA